MVAEIETDKASMEMDSQEEGFLAKILVPGGTSDVIVGTPIAILAEEQEDVAKFAQYAAADTGAPESSESRSEGQAASTSSSSGPAPGPKASRLGPAVLRLARQLNVDPASVSGTGPDGMVVKGDLLGSPPSASPLPSKPAPSTPAPAATDDAAPDDHEDVPHTTIRRIIAKGLLDSKLGFPHQYATIDVELDPLLKFRKELKELGVVASVNDFVVKAVAVALRENPNMNSFWDESAGEARRSDSVDIAVAVATDGGLITPVVYGADGKKVAEINEEVKDLAARARANKLKPHEFQGGTFTISNLGMFGIKEFSAIINPYGTQGAIMAVGGGQERTVMEEDGSLGSVTVMTCQVSLDGRAFGGQEVGAFLKTFARKLENPSSLLM